MPQQKVLPLARLMAMYAVNSDEQMAQTSERLRIAATWEIPEGARVLEIGCGQGDMTAVLASIVGAQGSVTAVDIGHPEYGAPVTIGASTHQLAASELGDRIRFHLEFDILDPSVAFARDSFDYVVLAHASWYFASLDLLQRVLLRARRWSRHLCFAEWDLEITSIDQAAHLLAVLIQGQVEPYKDATDANVRTPFSRGTLVRLLRETGWVPSEAVILEETGVEDARYEVEECLASSLVEVGNTAMPARLKDLIRSEVEVLQGLAHRHPLKALASYSIVAERVAEPELK